MLFKLVFLVTMTFSQASGEITDLGGRGFSEAQCLHLKDVAYERLSRNEAITEIVELNCVPID